jgi:hypothetical protein
LIISCLIHNLCVSQNSSNKEKSSYIKKENGSSEKESSYSRIDTMCQLDYSTILQNYFISLENIYFANYNYDLPPPFISELNLPFGGWEFMRHFNDSMLCLFGWTIVHFVFIERKKHYPNYCMQ